MYQKQTLALQLSFISIQNCERKSGAYNTREKCIEDENEISERFRIYYSLQFNIWYKTERIRICKQLYKMNVSNYFKSLKPCPIQLGLFRVTSTTIESWCSFQFVSPFCQFLLLLLNHVAVYCFMPSFQPCKSCIALSLRNSLIKI